jgi:hypothetical protein
MLKIVAEHIQNAAEDLGLKLQKIDDYKGRWATGETYGIAGQFEEFLQATAYAAAVLTLPLNDEEDDEAFDAALAEAEAAEIDIEEGGEGDGDGDDEEETEGLLALDEDELELIDFIQVLGELRMDNFGQTAIVWY